MIALLQRVAHASVEVDGSTIASIETGILVFLCAEKEDAEREAETLVKKIVGYRVFPDAAGKMNLDLRAAGGGLLLVPQFTLAADTRSGTRPSFSPCADPTLASRLFDHVTQYARSIHPAVATGQFGAHMKVALINDGPVTFWLKTGPESSRKMIS